MDPNATLARLIAAALEGDAAELRAAADELAEWLERGGFAPRAPLELMPALVAIAGYLPADGLAHLTGALYDAASQEFNDLAGARRRDDAAAIAYHRGRRDALQEAARYVDGIKTPAPLESSGSAARDRQDAWDREQNA